MTPVVELGLLALGLYLAHWASRKLGLSGIVGYILLGLLFGPYGPVTVFESSPVTEMLGELGIILLLFFMGLEFSLPRFLETRKETTVAGLLDLLNYVAGFLVGLLLGLGFLGSLFLGAIVYVSSSGVIAKLMTERDLIAYPEAERTLGVLVFEDLAMVVVLGGLGILTSGGFTAFLGVVGFVLVYLLLLRFGRALLTRLFSREGEALVLLSLALVVLFSMGAKGLGFPEAVAAFLLGMMIAETPFKNRVASTLHPWHDVAAAVFFLDFALHVNLSEALHQWPAALLLVGVTVLVNTLTGYFSGRLSGLSVRGSIGHGLMLLPRGEFSLVVVGLAAGVAALPEALRAALSGMTSLYVVAMVLLGSLVFRAYDPLTTALTERLQNPAARRLEAERQRELGGVRLD